MNEALAETQSQANLVAQLEPVVADSSSGVLDRILSVAREMLQMDFAYIAAFANGQQVHVKVDGDAASFGAPGTAPLDGTICALMVDDRVPNVIPDTRAQSLVRDLEIVADADIGAYVGVPVRFSNGRLFGTLCCLSHDADASLADRDAAFIRVLARVAAD